MGNDTVKLRDKIDTALQDAEAGKDPKVAFIDIWQDVQADYESMRDAVHHYLSRLFDENCVRATIASRRKTLDSIAKSINRRNDAKPQGQKYQSPRDIFNDLHDLVGFRVVVDYPSGLDKSYHLIEERFQVERYNSFSSDRTIGQHWKTRFGAYETRNYLLRLGRSEDIANYTGVLLEIQVTTMAESLYNKLAHPLLYKEFKGGLSRKDEMIIDMGHGAALLYWITVACMEERLEGAQEGGDRGSRFPNSVRNLAGDEVTATSLDAVVHATPDIPSTPQNSTSINFLLKALADIRISDASEENIWETIREKLGFDQHQLLGSLPTVPEARFDSKDLEDSPKCHKNTRQEVRCTIKSWVDDNTAEIFFWLHAPAGVGKSTLARTLVDDLRHLQLAAGYFFRRGNELRNDTSRVFPTIAGQLTRTIPSFANALRRSIVPMDIGSMDKISLRDQFNTLIYNPLCSIKHMPYNMLMIFDALDECTKLSNIQTILELLARLKDLETFRICIFFSSRNTRLLHNAFQPFKVKMACREMALHEQSLAATRLEMKAVLMDGLQKVKEQSNIKQDPWPSAEDFNTILRYATSPSPLFIYTSTFLRHMNSRDPEKRLQRWLETSRRSVSQLDHIYDPIMKSILLGDGDDSIQDPLDRDEILNLQLILGFLVLVTRPMSAGMLQAFLGMDESKFKMTLESLHAVVRVTDDDTPINLIHKSFADYILAMKDEAAANFRIDFTWVHGQLAERCLERMRQGLRKNICNAGHPLITRREFNKDMVTKSIPLDLTYACTHWVHHLKSSQKGLDLARAFLEKHLLHWLEALSILGALNEGGIAVGILLSLAQNNPDAGALPGPDIIKEAQIFLRANIVTIKKYPLQIYAVCLLREKASSRVKQLFAPSRATRLASLASIQGGVPVLPLGGYEIDIGGRHGLAISQDGQALAVHDVIAIIIADTRTGLVSDRIPGLIQIQAPWKPDTPRILAIDFSNDQLNIFGLTNDAKIVVGDTQSKRNPVFSGSLKAATKPFERGDVNVKGSMAVATRGTMVYVWKFQHGFDSITETCSLIEEPQVVNGELKNRITDVSLSAKGPTNWTIALINRPGYIFVWSASQKVGEGVSFIGSHRFNPYNARVAISPCGTLIASIDYGKICLWRWYKRQGSHVHTVSWPGGLEPYAVRFFPNGKAIAAVESAETSVIQIPEIFTAKRGKASEVQTKKVSRNEQIVSPTLFNAGAILNPQSTTRRWRHLFTSSHSYPQYAEIPKTGKVLCMHLASNKRTLVTLSETNGVLVWDIETGYLQHKIREARDIRAISSDGNTLADRGLFGNLVIWNLRTSPATLRSSITEPFKSPQCMEFTLDSRSLAVCDIGSLSCWNVNTAERQWIHEDPSLRGKPEGLT